MKRFWICCMAAFMLFTACDTMSSTKNNTKGMNNGDGSDNSDTTVENNSDTTVENRFALEFDAVATSPDEHNLSNWVQNNISYTDKNGEHTNKYVLFLEELKNGTVVIKSAPFNYKAAPHPFKMDFPILKKNIQKINDCFTFNKAKGRVTVLYAQPEAYMSGKVDFVTPASESLMLWSDGLGDKMQIKITLSNPQKYTGDAKP